MRMIVFAIGLLFLQPGCTSEPSSADITQAVCVVDPNTGECVGSLDLDEVAAQECTDDYGYQHTGYTAERISYGCRRSSGPYGSTLACDVCLSWGGHRACFWCDFSTLTGTSCGAAL